MSKCVACMVFFCVAVVVALAFVSGHIAGELSVADRMQQRMELVESRCKPVNGCCCKPAEPCKCGDLSQKIEDMEGKVDFHGNWLKHIDGFLRRNFGPKDEKQPEQPPCPCHR